MLEDLEDADLPFIQLGISSKRENSKVRKAGQNPHKKSISFPGRFPWLGEKALGKLYKNTKWMSKDCKRNCQIRIEGHEVEKIDQFSYLESMINVQGGADADVKTRIGKTRQVFTSLKPVWSCKRISLRIKNKPLNSSAKTAPLHGSESWKTTQEILS